MKRILNYLLPQRVCHISDNQISMSSATLLLLLLHHTALVCTSVHQTLGLSGAVVAVSCQVSSAKCGDYHSIKWYKEGGRVAVYSPATKWWRVEGRLHDRAQVKVDEENANLTFTLSAGDEGQYKCEITFPPSPCTAPWCR